MTIERVTPVIKAADVVMGPTRVVGSAPPILQQAEAVASAVWNRTDPAQQFFENNVRILSIMPIFSPQPELNAADAISEAESILTKPARAPSGAGPAVKPVVFLPAEPTPAIQPAIRPIIGVSPAATIRAENQLSPAHAANKSLPAIGEVSHQRQEISIEENVEEKGLEEQPREIVDEEIIQDKRVYSEDEQASLQRRYEIKEATKKAKVEAIKRGLKKITGWLVAHFLPAEHVGNRSQVVRKKGPDGSYQETVEAISLSGEFDSEQQAQERFAEIVTEKPPVKKGKNGRRVDQESVARVYKYHLVKPSAIVEIIRTRIIKKTIQVPGQNLPQTTVTEIPEIGVEHSLYDNPELAAVLNPPVLTDLNSLS